MKSFLMAVALGVLVSLTGCVTGGQPVTVAPVGPDQNRSSDGGAQGLLSVFSAYDAAGNNGDTYVGRHTDYQLYSADGQLLQTVHNHTGNTWDGPTVVKLAPGHYRVEARANGYSKVTVPVVVEAGKQTSVHLEGGIYWPADVAQSNTVRLPDGRIIGWGVAK